MSQPELQRLLPRHFAIVDLALAGHSVKDIAMAMDCTPQSVSIVMKSPNFQNELSRRRETKNKLIDSELASVPSRAKQKLDSLSLAAAENLEETLTSALDPKLRFQAAESILDRVLGGSKDQAQRPVVMLSQGDINLILLAAKESGAPTPVAITPPPIDVPSAESHAA
jgi:hypothetical protein